MPTHLVAPDDLLRQLPASLRARLTCHPAESLSDARWAEVEAALAAGDSLILIGAAALPRLRHLWVATHDCPATDLATPDFAPLPLPAVPSRPAACHGLCLRPDTLHAYFGRDEMPRADLTPLLEALDDSGQACAWPAVWLKHTAPSLVSGRFVGSNWYLFAFDVPLCANPPECWAELIGALADHAGEPLAVTGLRAHYSCLHPGETAQIQIQLANHSPHLAAARLDCTLLDPSGAPAHSRWVRRSLNGGDRITVPWEFACPAEPGLWRVRVALHHEDRFKYGAARDKAPLVETATCAFVVAPADASGYPRAAIQGRSLAIAGHDGFLGGTHYYPSSSWWDWAWRDFRPEHAARDLDQMARLGYRLVRVWIDPELDEQALRGYEAWLHLSAAHGIVSSVCVFSQWSRHLSYPADSGMTTFEFMGPADYQVYSVQLTNIEHQQRYLATLARRWRDLPNLIWNLANETYIVDPDPSQVDEHYFGDVEPRTGPLAGAAYFNRWADLMTEALRATGAGQPILRGYGFVNGGDCYLQNRTGDLLTWHHYAPPEIAGPCLAFAAPGLLDKPLLLEEFGISSLDEAERLERYEGVACWAAVMGAAGACSYEWGVSWLTRELPFVATPLKDCCLSAEPDPRWMRGQVAYSESWPLGSMGLCPWAASFSFGSNFPCTPFPTPAAVALADVARFCAEIGPPVGTAPVVLVVPMEWAPFAPLGGYARQLDSTWQTIHALAAAHVPFTLIQEDQLQDLQEAPPCLLRPSAGQGALPEAVLAHAVDLDATAPVWCVRRGTRAGRLYLLYAPNGPASLRLREGSIEVALDLRRYALVEIPRHGETRRFVGTAEAPARRQIA